MLSDRRVSACLVTWPNGRMDQDKSWYGGRPCVRPHCVSLLDGDPAPLKQEQSTPPHFCGHTSGWIKMSLGTRVDLSAGHILLDGDPATTPEKDTAASPLFGRPSQLLLSTC